MARNIMSKKRFRGSRGRSGPVMGNETVLMPFIFGLCEGLKHFFAFLMPASLNNAEDNLSYVRICFIADCVILLLLRLE